MYFKLQHLFAPIRYFKKSVSHAQRNGSSQLNQKKYAKPLLLMGSTSVFLWCSSEQDQLTGRRRLNILKDKNREEFSKMIGHVYPEWNMDGSRWIETKIEKVIELNLKDRKVPKTHPAHDMRVSKSHPWHERIEAIVAQLIDNNSDLNLSTPIVHLTYKGSRNAYSLGNHIVICTDGLEDISDDQLAFLIAHEMAHHLLDHVMENVSWMMVELLTGLYLLFVLPRKIMFALVWVILKPFRLGIVYPIKRRFEFEADDIGLEMSMKAGVDPKEVMIFWDILENLKPDIPGLQFINDHPLRLDRKLRMDQNINSR